MYLKPRTLDEAVDALERHSAQVLAGGTDFYPALGENQPDRPVVDITALKEIKGRSLIESKPRAILFLRIASDIVRLPAFAVLLVLAFEPRWANRTEPVP